MLVQVLVVSNTQSFNQHQYEVDSPISFKKGAVPTFSSNMKSEARSMSFIGLAIVINMPQLYISLMDTICNGILSSICLGKEFIAFTKTYKPLRVSKPSGKQRSTYWLQLPIRSGMPLLIIMAILRWITSQTLFILRATKYDFKDVFFAERSLAEMAANTVNVIGYSDIAWFVFIGINVSMAIILLSLRTIKIVSGGPLVGTCSLAISAACHLGRDEDPTAAPFQPLMYGVIQTDGFEVNRVGFSAQEVQPLVDGLTYH